MNVDDFITYIERPEDYHYLKTELLPVSTRLFKSSPDYQGIILSCCGYIRKIALTTMEGYKKPHGMSGANLAVPFNIIGVVSNRNTKEEDVLVMINPILVKTIGRQIKVKSNCGSIRLKEPIDILRYQDIIVQYYYIHEGRLVHTTNRFNRDSGALTIQHEIDHNKGILITDL